jgi:predicted nucleic acid-binding protein
MALPTVDELVKIYLDVSCLNRPFDNQDQTRIRLEAEATKMILEQCERGVWQQLSSTMATIEIAAIPDAKRRTRVRLLLPAKENTLKLTPDVFDRAEKLEAIGFKPADATHVAAAEALKADVFLSCDDRLCRLAKRRRTELKVRAANPLEWLKEIGHEFDTK